MKILDRHKYLEVDTQKILQRKSKYEPTPVRL